jgi:hypothetical protein
MSHIIAKIILTAVWLIDQSPKLRRLWYWLQGDAESGNYSVTYFCSRSGVCELGRRRER